MPDVITWNVAKLGALPSAGCLEELNGRHHCVPAVLVARHSANGMASKTSKLPDQIASESSVRDGGCHRCRQRGGPAGAGFVSPLGVGGGQPQPGGKESVNTMMLHGLCDRCNGRKPCVSFWQLRRNCSLIALDLRLAVCPVLRRGTTQMAAKGPDEVGHRAKPAPVGNLADAQARVQQQFAGFFHATEQSEF